MLLDRPVGAYPERGGHDLAVLDHRRAGYVIADHLLQVRARRVAFVGLPDAAATVEARAAGYRAALFARDASFESPFVHRLDPAEAESVRSLMDATRPDAIVCANDGTAATLDRVSAADVPPPRHPSPRHAGRPQVVRCLRPRGRLMAARALEAALAGRRRPSAACPRSIRRP